MKTCSNCKKCTEVNNSLLQDNNKLKAEKEILIEVLNFIYSKEVKDKLENDVNFDFIKRILNV